MIIAGAALFALAFLCSLLMTLLAKKTAGRMGFMDQPGQRKVHAAPTPRNGGIGIFWGIALPILASLAAISIFHAAGQKLSLPASVRLHLPGLVHQEPLAWLLLGCMLGIHILGLVDDRRALGPWSKLFWQFSMAAALVAGGECMAPGAFRVLTFLDHFGMVGVIASMALSVVWLVLLTNAFNFLDNMDGLSAGVAFLCALMFFLAALYSRQWFICALLTVYMGSILGFLCFNFPPASIFMGDGGSMVLGFFLAALTMRTTYYPGHGRWYAVFMPLIVVAVPLYDMAVVSVLRLRRGKSPLVGDANHFSHRLTRHGFSKRSAVLIIYAITLACGLSAPLLARANPAQAALIAGQCVSILVVIGILERLGEHTT